MSASQHQLLNRQVLLKDLGTISYEEGLRMQEEFHQKVVSGELPGVVLVLQHKPVLTLGKHADLGNILVAQKDLAAKGVEIMRTDRGGEVTAHMPGQIVVYPILPVLAFGLGARDYVNGLMQAVIKTLAKWDVKARCDAEFPGVWVGKKKICAVGVRIKERVSLHGIALNVNNSLELFDSIVPCGIKHLGVTNLSLENPEKIDLAAVQNELCQSLAETLCLDFPTAK